MQEKLMDASDDSKKAPDIDAAVNIFAKPWQTALTLLSLHQASGQHIWEYWLQFEPAGSKFDKIPPYHIVPYLTQELGLRVHVFQPEIWQARTPADPYRMADREYRKQLRYGQAFEGTKNHFLFLTHNDVFFRKDLVGALRQNIGDAFAIGQLGQCWNCPASNDAIMESVMGCSCCTPLTYMKIRPTFEQLAALYKKAREIDFPARPYDKRNFSREFERQPWPLPECRVNEWACLLNMDMIRPACMPFGAAWPPGAFRDCSGHNLDVVTPTFRDLHAQGMHAKHFNFSGFMDHFVGTGNKSGPRYSFSEDRAKKLLEKFFPDYIAWIKTKTPDV